MSVAAPHLVAFEQCGVELQAPHLRTRTKRRIETPNVDAARLPSDSLRFIGWAPEVIEAVFPDLHPAAVYELEATFLGERSVRRVQAIVAGDVELVPPTELGRGTATTVRVVVPPETYRTGTLEVRVVRVEGPDVVLSELRLYSSTPAAPTITVVGDSRGGLIGTVAAADSTGVPDVTVRIGGDAGTFEVRTDRAGVFRLPLGAHLPLDEGLPLGRHGTMTVSTEVGGVAAEVGLDSRHLARGLRELPPPADRVDLNGRWRFHGGPFRGHGEADAELATTRVPGHIVFDGLVPEDGVGTFHRSFDRPGAIHGRAVFLRFDGAYGRAEVRVNGSLAGVHGSGATSFDVDVTPFLRPGSNDLAVTLTEFTPHAVLDDMSWYAHMSLLGIWRDVCLFTVPLVHLGQLGIDADWDRAAGSGSLDLDVDVINLHEDPAEHTLVVTLRDGARTVHEATRTGTVGGQASDRVSISSGPLAVEPWTAEQPRLYDLQIEVRRPGTPAQTWNRRIGFRRVETRGNQLLVNGAPIRIRGMNRHDSRILQGRALSHDDMREDVVNLRRANVNVIRTSHYPPSPHLLEICDEVGMFVFEQPPICFSGGFDDHHWTRTNEAAPLIPVVLEVTAETVARDDGHCSVIVWDLGNESRWGAAFDAQLALVREMDPHRPTIFSFDLNELGPENQLVRKPVAERPQLRSYHYPGWDRTWQEDLAWLGADDQPTVLDEFAPVFAPCLRGVGEGYGLAIDPGIRDYWGAGYQPFMAAALQDRGVIGGMVWGGFGEVFAIPLDLTVGEGPWAHLPVTDYVRTHDHYPQEPGVYRRGDGDWGVIDGWNRPRPELWHVHGMYSPIEWGAEAFERTADRLEVAVTNRFSHRSLAGLEVRVHGGRLADDTELTALPGETDGIAVVREAGSGVVRIELWHAEGWLVDGREWSWPGAETIQEAVLERAVPIALGLSPAADVSLSGDDRSWLRGWPQLHLLDVDQPHVAVPVPAIDPRRVVAASPGEARAPIAGNDWEGSLTARVDARTVVFEYEVRYRGGRSFNAKEVGLTFRPSPDLMDLWWRRNGEWTVYPDDHVGRASGTAAGRPGTNGALRPAATWPQDATAAGSNDYRSTKRWILAAGATDGRRSLSVLSDGRQHVRAELADGLPVLHVLDWYGGVRTVEGNHPIWSAYFGAGCRITPGMTLRGRVVVAVGDRP